MTLAALVLTLFAMTPAEAASEPILLDFHAAWCGPCKTMRPHVEKLAQAGYPVKSIDIDASPELAKRYQITGVPAFVVVDGEGREMARTTGAQSPSEIAAMYRKVQAKLQAVENERRAEPDDTRSRPGSPRTIPVSESDDDEESKTEEEIRNLQERAENPKPWETVVRIKMYLSPQAIGNGSGTIIYSSAEESIILTCAHIFKLEGRPTPPPKQFPVRIDIDLFDGNLVRQTVHSVETVRGEAIDYDFVNDVGLIRIRPGRRLPATPVVPVTWKPKQGLKMITVGCSEGQDATAWSTRILRPEAMLQHVKGGKTVPFSVIECEHAPKQGRSGGGLYTEDGFVAGVCDFADTRDNRGLYATPKSIYGLLDRNRLTALYRPEVKDGGRMLANNNAPARRPNTIARGQTPREEPDHSKITLPDPHLIGIPEPKLAAASTEPRPANSAAKGTFTWRTRNPVAAEPTPPQFDPPKGATTAEMVMDPAPSDFDRRPEPADGEVDGVSPEAPIIKPSGKSNWRPIRKAGASL